MGDDRKSMKMGNRKSKALAVMGVKTMKKIDLNKDPANRRERRALAALQRKK